MTKPELSRDRPEADLLREVFADDATIVANAIADLLRPRAEAEKPRMGADQEAQFDAT